MKYSRGRGRRTECVPVGPAGIAEPCQAQRLCPPRCPQTQNAERSSVLCACAAHRPWPFIIHSHSLSRPHSLSLTGARGADPLPSSHFPSITTSTANAQDRVSRALSTLKSLGGRSTPLPLQAMVQRIRICCVRLGGGTRFSRTKLGRVGRSWVAARVCGSGLGRCYGAWDGARDSRWGWVAAGLQLECMGKAGVSGLGLGT